MPFRVELRPPKPMPANVPVAIFNRRMAEASITASNRMKLAAVGVTPKVTGLTAGGWKTIAPERKGDAMTGGIEVIGPAGMTALVLEKGAKRHFPPVGGGKIPALQTWIQRALTNPTLTGRDEEGRPVIRPANTRTKRDISRLAFLIGRAIKRRGLPRSGHSKEIYSRALENLGPEIDRIMQMARDLMVADMNAAGRSAQ